MKDEFNKLSEEEKIHTTNLHLLEDTDVFEEQCEITLKPFQKLWNDVSQKIKWVNKPKKSHPYFDSIYIELLEIYGEELGRQIMRIIMDIIEVEFHKLNGRRIEFFDILYGGCSLNQWVKLINTVDKIFSVSGNGSHLIIQKKVN